MAIKVYLDTSTLSACDDERVPEFGQITRDLFNGGRDRFVYYVSKVVVAEVDAAPETKARKMHGWMKLLHCNSLDEDEMIRALALSYLRERVLPEKSVADAFHMAYATYYKMDYLLSWNFSHLANERRNQAMWKFNFKQGLGSPKIVTPGSLLET